MTNIPPERFCIGTLASVSSLSLVLGVGQRRHDFIATVHEGKKWAVAIDRAGAFNSFECSEAVNHWGVIVPNVCLEADLNSRTDFYDSGHGALVRSGGSLGIFVKPGRYGESTSLIPLLGGLDRRDTAEIVGFLKWRVLVRDSLKETSLYNVDVSTSKLEDDDGVSG